MWNKLLFSSVLTHHGQPQLSVDKCDHTGVYELLMPFDMRMADLWQKFTAANVHKRIGMLLGTDQLLCAPQIMCEIAGGTCCAHLKVYRIGRSYGMVHIFT